MKFIDCFPNPYALSLAFSKLWSMLSNALERPTYTEIWRILFENIDRFDYTLASHTLYLD